MPRLLMLLQSFISISNGPGQFGHISWTKLQPSLVYDIAPQWSLQTGASPSQGLTPAANWVPQQVFGTGFDCQAGLFGGRKQMLPKSGLLPYKIWIFWQYT
jgi:hypothetical protein